MKNFTLLLLLFILPFTSMSAFEVDGITYEVVGDGAVGVAYGHYSGEMVIPSTVSYGGQEYAVTEILGNAFWNRSELTAVVIPNGITNVREGAFASCRGLTSVTIPSGVVGDYVFFNCTNLVTVVFGPDVTDIGSNIFDNCTNLRDIYALNEDDALTLKSLLSNASNISLHVPLHLKEAYQESWADANIIATAVIDGVAYQNTDGGTVSLIQNEDHNYGGNFVIPEKFSYKDKEYTVTGVGSRAFEDCTELVSVSIPGTVTQIGTNVDNNAFKGCSNLMSIEVAEENEAYKSVDGVLYDKEMLNLLQYPAGRQGAFSVPEGVTGIEGESFYGCTGLTAIELPETTEFVGSYTFYGCTGLTSVTIPNRVTYIWYRAFAGCTGLKNLVLGENVLTIYNLAFENCTGLQDIYALCKYGPRIYIHGMYEGEDAFSEETYANATLYVPEGEGSYYSGADYWKQFQHIVETNLAGVERAPVEGTEVEVIDGKLRFNRDEAEVSIYDMSGKALFHGKARNGAAFTPAQSGTYVIAVDGKVQKVVLK